MAVIAGAAGANPAAAATVLGSTLKDGYEATYGGPALTVYQEAAPGETLTAPSSGSITAWSVRSGDMNAKYELRILRPSGGSFTAVGTSAAQTVPNAAGEVLGPFPVSLAVKAGDRIALDVIAGLGAPINTLAPMSDELNYFADPFAEGAMKEPALLPPTGANQELLLQASFTPGPPANTSLPVISGEARAGSALTANEGIWENAASYAFQWQRCTGATCTAIAGATSTSYTPTLADEGQQLRVAVTATGATGQMTTAYSERTNGVKAGPVQPPASTGLPTVTGEARETETLTAAVGNWTGSPTEYQYQWLHCETAAGGDCAPVAGATSSTYVLVRADVGATMRLRVTAVNSAGATTAESAPTGIVQPLVIRARFSIRPTGSCTGLPVELDGSTSQTPNGPIVNYEYTYKNYPQGVIFVNFYDLPYGPEQLAAAIIEEEEPQYLADGPNPVPTVSFTWDEVNAGRPPDRPDPYWRDPAIITLTVTDRSGATASVEQYLYFAQQGSLEPRSGCPDQPILRAVHFPFSEPRHFVVSKALVTSLVRCTTATPCAGKITVLAAHPLAVRAAAGAKAKPRIIASSPLVTIAAHHSAKVRAKVTKIGRALLKRGRRVHAIVRVTSVSPLGRTTTHSFNVVLRSK